VYSNILLLVTFSEAFRQCPSFSTSQPYNSTDKRCARFSCPIRRQLSAHAVPVPFVTGSVVHCRSRVCSSRIVSPFPSTTGASISYTVAGKGGGFKRWIMDWNPKDENQKLLNHK
jgi:hypothetical protein